MERYAGPTQCPLHEDAILQALCGKPSLQKLAIIGSLGTHAVGTSLDPKSVVYPVRGLCVHATGRWLTCVQLWRVSNLTSIVLSGDAFLKPSNGPHVRAMLNRSSATLEHLEVPLELAILQDCRFARLRRLKLRLLSGSNVSIDRSRVQFLANNPSIEELAWLPLGCCEVPPDILPKLRRVQTTVDVVRALCGDGGPPRAFEALDLERIAELFPNLIWLKLARGGVAATPVSSRPADAWLALLARFPRLETLRGPLLWAATAHDKGRMHALIGRLAQACPRLRALDHCVFYEKRHDWQLIVLMREADGAGGESVRYEIRRPPAV
ncbi:hypothetical protein HDZ31DRAFT_30184 [Schizophyllum fasciatum]